MIEFKRTDGMDPDFSLLVSQLDAYLAEKDGLEHNFYHQFNGISDIQYALVGYWDGQPVLCGAIKAFGENAMEVKRMFTLPSFRGQGLAERLLQELESWAAELGAKRLVLETGKRQVEAIRLYTRCKFSPIPNYGQYIGIENSCCFEKPIS